MRECLLPKPERYRTRSHQYPAPRSLVSTTLILREQLQVSQPIQERPHRSQGMGELVLQCMSCILTLKSQPGQLFCRTHPTNLPAPPPVVSHVSSVSWSQHQRDAFQPSDIYGGTGTLVPSRHLQTTNRIELVPASSAPVSAGGLGESHINLYTPRPSTAPIGQAKTPGRDLPPERMLPFTTNPIIQQASVPGRVEDSVVPMGDTLRNTPKTMMKQDKGDFKLGTMPSFATPRYSSQTSIMDTSRLQNVAAVDEEEIDTQEILAKAQARLARSSTRLNQTKNAGEFKCVADGHNTTTSQKKRRNLRCLQCRSARTKCERDAKNPEGTCQPCQAKERQCSFAADADFHSEACETEKPAVYAQNSQEEAQSETQSLRRSARQQEASLKADVNSLPPRIMSPEPPKEVKVVKHEVSKKRVIKSSSIDIEQKRPKTSDVSSLRHPPGTPPHFVKSTHSRCQPQPALGKARTHNRTLQEVTNLSAHPRSDATTITTVTSDLDAPYPISPVKKMADVTPAEPKPPLSHQLEADPDAREVQDQHNDTENTTSVRSPLTPSKFGSNIRADEVPISTFLNLHDSEQSTMLDKFFATAIQDDDFLQFCKILENRYEPMLFPNKW